MVGSAQKLPIFRSNLLADVSQLPNSDAQQSDGPVLRFRELSPAPDIAAALRRFANLPHSVLLDSAMRHPELGRYSFLSADPIDFEVADTHRSSIDQLEEFLKRHHLDDLSKNAKRGSEKSAAESTNDQGIDFSFLPPFRGGAIGVLGYDMNQDLEAIPPNRFNEFQFPKFGFGIYDAVIAWDHLTDRAWIVASGLPGEGISAARSRADSRIEQFHKVLCESSESELENSNSNLGKQSPVTDLAPQFPVAKDSRLTSNFPKELYLNGVQKCIDYIYAGDLFQVNLSQRLLFPQTCHWLVTYLELRRRNPATFAGCFDLGKWQVLSASPERFLKSTSGEIETRPIKGTRRRTQFPEVDLDTAVELKQSEKDRSENVMIVDLLRNDLARICEADSIKVSQLCEIESYQYVQHLVSAIEGRLKSVCTTTQLIKATFPGGSITGAPKVRAMEIIAELEPTGRGAYCGSMGYIGFDGTIDFNILIRTITASGGYFQFPVGGGIVSQSKPEREHEETWEKANGMLQALDI